MEGFTCLYSISEKGSPIHCRVTGRQRYLVDLCQGSNRVELRYHGIIFVGTLIFVGLIFMVEHNHENFFVYGIRQTLHFAFFYFANGTINCNRLSDICNTTIPPQFTKFPLLLVPLIPKSKHTHSLQVTMEQASKCLHAHSRMDS